MSRTQTFDQLLDAVEELSPDAQAELVRVVQRRLAERGRQRIVEEARQSKSEFEAGDFRVTTVDDLMRKIEE